MDEKTPMALEKGEVGIVALQFTALAVVILVLSNFLPIANATTTDIGKVYWGTPSTGVALAKEGVNVEVMNATMISAYYTISNGAQPASASAYRLCLDSHANNTGGIQDYTDIQLNYSASRHANYLTFGPTDQAPNLTCTYTISLTDSLQNVVSWTATVRVNATSA